MQQLRVGVIGLGVGEQHLAAYEKDPFCRVAAICDTSADVLATVAARHAGVRGTTDPTAVLMDGEIDLVSIASYDQCHFEQALTALESGKHVFVEKPLCRTVEELATLKRAWSRHEGRLHLASNLVLRAAPLYRWLRAEIAQGSFGAVYAIDGDYLYGRLHKITEGWRGSVENYSVVQGGGIHLLDLMMWLTGQRPVSVTAAGNRIATEGTAFRHNDFASATFTFPSGMVGRLTANFGCVHRHHHGFRVFGTQATFIYDDAGARLHTSRDPAARPDRIAHDPLPATKGALIPDFVRAATGTAALDPGSQHEFDVISAAVAADLAMSSGQRVEPLYL